MYKILFVHNLYQQAGGEDNVVKSETDLLRSNGHEVLVWTVDNKNLSGGLLGKVKTALSANYSIASKLTMQEKLRSFRPDIVHVHNFFPQISPSVYDACLEEHVPVVQTLHNYRLICPGALLMRSGKICELCVSGSPYQAVRYGCYRGSNAGSLAVAHMVANHRNQKTWNNKVNRFIALTEFAKSKFVEAGFPEQKITVKPNFVALRSPATTTDKALPPYALFVGRISEEKGIKTLVNAWKKLGIGYPLKIAGTGDGHLLHLLGQQDNIEVLGLQDSVAVHELMQKATALVMPSEWYEGFPMVLVEAFSHGLPVIASNLGSMAEIVHHMETGLLFTPGNPDELADRVRWLMDNPELSQRMAKNTQSAYWEHYTPEQNLGQLLGIYAQAIETNIN